MDLWMALLSGGLGVGFLTMVWFMVRRAMPSRGDRYWDEAENQAALLEARGYTGNWFTAGHYVFLIAWAISGLGLLAGACSSLPVIGGAALVMSIACMFFFACVLGIALIVARTGRPRRWVPARYRGDS